MTKSAQRADRVTLVTDQFPRGGHQCLSVVWTLCPSASCSPSAVSPRSPAGHPLSPVFVEIYTFKHKKYTYTK